MVQEVPEAPQGTGARPRGSGPRPRQLRPRGHSLETAARSGLVPTTPPPRTIFSGFLRRISGTAVSACAVGREIIPFQLCRRKQHGGVLGSSPHSSETKAEPRCPQNATLLGQPGDKRDPHTSRIPGRLRLRAEIPVLQGWALGWPRPGSKAEGRPDAVAPGACLPAVTHSGRAGRVWRSEAPWMLARLLAGLMTGLGIWTRPLGAPCPCGVWEEVEAGTGHVVQEGSAGCSQEARPSKEVK